MSFWLKVLGIGGGIFALIGSVSYLTVADKWGSIFVILALIITLLKQIIAFIGFLTTAIKFLVIFIFVSLLVAVGLLVLRAWKDKQKPKE